jgi:hypothetical protein
MQLGGFFFPRYRNNLIPLSTKVSVRYATQTEDFLIARAVRPLNYFGNAPPDLRGHWDGVRGPSQQIVGRNPQDETFTPHLNRPQRETVDDGCSYRNQRVCVSGRVFPEYAALHL